MRIHLLTVKARCFSAGSFTDLAHWMQSVKSLLRFQLREKALFQQLFSKYFLSTNQMRMFLLFFRVNSTVLL